MSSMPDVRTQVKGDNSMAVQNTEFEAGSNASTRSRSEDDPKSTNLVDPNTPEPAPTHFANSKHHGFDMSASPGKIPRRNAKRIRRESAPAISFPVHNNNIDDGSDNEKHETAEKGLVWDQLGSFFSNLKQPLEVRRKKARMRLLQTKAYAELMEDRISDLESRVRIIEKKPSSFNDEGDSIERLPRNHHNVTALSWVEFRAHYKIEEKERREWIHRPEWDLQPKSIIEILRDEPRISWDTSQSRENPKPIYQVTAFEVQKGSESEQYFEPQRIRIRSKLLLQLLNEVTECRTSVGKYRHRLVFLKPFKLLVTFERELKSRLADLVSLHSARNAEAESQEIAGALPADGTRPPNVIGPVKETDSINARDQLHVLCNMMRQYLGTQIALRHGQGLTKVKFADLWHLFKLGREIRTRGDSQIQVYRIISVTGGRENLSFRGEPEVSASKKLKDESYSEGSFLIECLHIDFDGSRYGPVNTTFQIQKFEGEKDIDSLPVYPLSCSEDEGELRRRLLDRGVKFAKLAEPQGAVHRKYKGLTLDKHPEQVESEIIIDFSLAFLKIKDEKPSIGIDNLVGDDLREVLETEMSSNICDDAGCCSNDIIHADYEVDIKERRQFRDNFKPLFELLDGRDQLSDDHRILLPPKVYGFVLRTRKWAIFDIDSVQPPDYSSGWDQLVINEENKATVLALVNNHERPQTSTTAAGGLPRLDGVLSAVDLVQGKGRGLIILLHGEPGVGKTSTAECVATHTHRPLFPITCGDIGDKAEAIEANLEQNFQLAHKWGCVLLLDEADIFLSSRTEEDIQRNAIVSVFLRTLEYYSGILFLTTNRVGKIDRAFKSRIHLSLFYPKLDRDATVRIWGNNLKRIREEFRKEKRDITIHEVEIIKFAKEHFKRLDRSKDGYNVWNGRQIRNAFQTATALACHEAGENSKLQMREGTGTEQQLVPMLQVKHFRKVAKSALAFDKYLYNLKQSTDGELARKKSERADDFLLSSGADDSETEKRERKRKRKNARKEMRRESTETDSDFRIPDSDSSTSIRKSKKSRKG